MSNLQEIVLQNIIFCKNNEKHRNLYYRTKSNNITYINNCLSFVSETNTCLSFDTYFNSFSLFAWFMYSIIDNIELSLQLKGFGKIELFGIDRKNQEFLIKKTDFNCKYDEVINIKIPESKKFIIIFFRIHAQELILYSGSWKSLVSISKIKQIVPAIGICTWKKENFIKNTVKEITRLNQHLKEKIYIHIADNGQTLNQKDFSNENIFLHSNVNAGGAGGFARCMLEALSQKPQVTHLLLMDDDIELEAESIYRTFTLYKIIKEKYQGSFIAGGMLNLKEKNIQVVREEGFFPCPPFRQSFRTNVDISNRSEFIYNDSPSVHNKNVCLYAGWWYCAFPITYLQNGLSYPFFFQLDDIEFSLRNNAKIIHLNGISVWHTPYWEKINHSKYYYSSRNTLIVSAFMLKNPFLPILRIFLQMYKQIFIFNYTSAYYIIYGLKSYNDGPLYLPVSSPWTIKPEIKNIFKKNKTNCKISIVKKKKNIFKIILALLTWNGHFLPDFFLSDKRCIEYQNSIFSCNIILNHSIYIVDDDINYTEYTISRKEALKCFILFIKETIRYFKKYKKISTAWKQTREKFISQEWWKQHLELNKKK